LLKNPTPYFPIFPIHKAAIAHPRIKLVNIISRHRSPFHKKSILNLKASKACLAGKGVSHLTDALQRSFGEPTTFPTMSLSGSPYRG
jgi:hypothetical protein